jgi:hypothetical protein
MTSCVLSAIALFAATSAYSADANKANVIRVYNDTVAPTDQVAYEDAVKAYNKCLAQHGFKFAWTALTHATGNTYMYSYVAGPHTWADFDTMHTAGKACDNTWMTQANPHLKDETSAFMVEMSELSHMPKNKDDKPALVTVTYFTLKNGYGMDDAFTAAVKKITAAAEKSNWSGYYTLYQARAAGDGAPDYVLLSPHKSWADYGAGANPSVWKMLEAADGKADADAVRKSLDEVIKKVSSHVDSYDADLTYTPAK